MRWTDPYDIAIALSEKYPAIEPLTVRFTDLRQWVLDLDDFDDAPDGCGCLRRRSAPAGVPPRRARARRWPG